MSTESTQGEPSKRNWASFASVLSVTALNAFNDNFARFTLVPLAAWLVARGGGFTGVQHVLAVMLVLPFILLAPTSGWISDRFAKNRVLVWSTWMQILVLGFMLLALTVQSLGLALLAFFLLAVQSTLLSPAKTGILKELLGSKRLALGSGLMDGVGILAILGGQVLSGFVFDARLRAEGDGWEAATFPLFVLGAGGVLSIVLSYLVEKTGAHERRDFGLKVAFGHFRDLKVVLENRSLKLSSLGVSFFWGFAGFLNLVIIQVAEELHGGGVGTGSSNSLMMGMASLGIAGGSILAGWLNRKGTELGLVPVGGVLMTLGTVVLAVLEPATAGFYTGLLVAAVGAAIFLVPLKAFLVDVSPSDGRGKVISVSNLMNNLAGISAVLIQFVLKASGVPVAWQFALFAVLGGWATWFVMKILPQQFWRLMALSMIRSIYRIRGFEVERMPKEGGVLLCPNHVSFVDALVLSAACPRPVRFLMARQMFEKKWVGDFARVFNAVPVSPERAKEAIRIAADEVKAGNVVCIFPEGQLTRSGAVVEMKKGFEMIARKAKCPVVPAYMHGLWGNFFSFAGGRYFRKWPRKFGAGVQVVFGEAIEAREATSVRVREEWRKMAAEALGREPIGQSDFADPAVFVREEPETWWGAVHEMGEMEEGDFAELARQARQLASVEFWRRDERILLEWDGEDAVSRVLGVLLPRLVGAKMVLIPKGGTGKDFLRVAREERVDKVVTTRGVVGDPLVGALVREGFRVQVLVDGVRKSSEEELPCLVAGGRIVSWSMPHPVENSPHALFQPGWKEGSAGRAIARGGSARGMGGGRGGVSVSLLRIDSA